MGKEVMKVKQRSKLAKWEMIITTISLVIFLAVFSFLSLVETTIDCIVAQLSVSGFLAGTITMVVLLFVDMGNSSVQEEGDYCMGRRDLPVKNKSGELAIESAMTIIIAVTLNFIFLSGVAIVNIIVNIATSLLVLLFVVSIVISFLISMVSVSSNAETAYEKICGELSVGEVRNLLITEVNLIFGGIVGIFLSSLLCF